MCVVHLAVAVNVTVFGGHVVVVNVRETALLLGALHGWQVVDVVRDTALPLGVHGSHGVELVSDTLSPPLGLVHGSHGVELVSETALLGLHGSHGVELVSETALLGLHGSHGVELVSDTLSSGLLPQGVESVRRETLSVLPAGTETVPVTFAVLTIVLSSGFTSEARTVYVHEYFQVSPRSSLVLPLASPVTNTTGEQWSSTTPVIVTGSVPVLVTA
jgi:hypothetical protein